MISSAGTRKLYMMQLGDNTYEALIHVDRVNNFVQ